MGVLEGAITYANLLVLLSLGLTLTYITTGVPNFAHGSFAAIGAYFAFTVFKLLGINPYFAVPLSFILGGIIGVITYTFILKPLIKRNASLEMLMIATLAWDIILFGVIGAFAESISTVVKSPATQFVFTYLDFTIGGIPGRLIVSSLLILLTLFGLYILLYKTKFGIALRASMENPALAEAMGINVESTRLFSWFLAGALASMAGSVLPFLQEIVPATGGLIIVSIFAASIVGGLHHIAGALVGGYVIGLSESLITYGLSSIFGTGVLVYGKVVSLLIMIATLLMTPEGITGTKLWGRLVK
ncbi:branched-chain amino acid ABC transporter permease [Thermococcus sp. M39]|uniref:branched-chain amino acid ABC transporter permease n=1 Tax=unclassified Thermococcus TaxID=2627626 RepID=UPI001438D2D6|nr:MULTISPECIES: branched-chain amino acid ABC transporter permease [unclassified Thermococcus]NJE09160.1 branched-chain amino acid ABC transporter permease [Thermococcus sp. M39]NJE13079.1 branched-chain amino acid ABC transporter permease [Thermococcus sp. LS2]